ncbi:MAG: hypothetical protein L0Y70_24940 [Gemmataceae bacterium]|nr:hypothetical protein [Gemmataceae bacterium]
MTPSAWVCGGALGGLVIVGVASLLAGVGLLPSCLAVVGLVVVALAFLRQGPPQSPPNRREHSLRLHSG